MRSKSILATAASALITFALITAFSAPSATARDLIAPANTCENESGFGNVTKARESMVCLTNYARHEKGLRPYRVVDALTKSAERKALDIRRCNAFSHSACGREFIYWMNRTGYAGAGRWTVGENIAWGSGSYGTSRSIFRAWMNSPGHRRAILSRDYRDIGVGVVSGRLSGAAGARIWVQHFGRRG